ncbi:unnamed protein product [Caenorhabditis sp. 36 PRJEB53466]|nr:unnamed protein product [Caenorhabditis sp. 36 PRJEB53466]
MDNKLHFEVCRKKSHYFLEVSPTDDIEELKRQLEGITAIPVKNMWLWKLDKDGNKLEALSNHVTFQEYGYNQRNAMAQRPALIGLRVINEESELKIDHLPKFEGIARNGDSNASTPSST